MQSVNRVELTARMNRTEPLRHTPAGIPVLHLTLEHESQVQEAGAPRKVTLELRAVALGDLAQSLAQADNGIRIEATGFLAPQRQGSDRLVLHLQQIAQAQ
jgi:primosomal replication protein N